MLFFQYRHCITMVFSAHVHNIQLDLLDVLFKDFPHNWNFGPVLNDLVILEII